MSEGWTQAELEALAREWPVEVDQFTTRATDGSLVPTMTKAEVRALIARYPSCFTTPSGPRPAPAGATEEERALAARYPTMKR